MGKYRFISVLTTIVGIVLSTNLWADDLQWTKVCNVNDSILRMSCDIRFSEIARVESANAYVSQTSIASEYIEYAGNTQRNTLIYILIDTSDPGRKSIVEKKIASVKYILESASTNTQIGVAVFDAGLREIQSPTTNINLINQALQDIQVSGKITEFYRSILQGLERVKEISAHRNFLVVLSDGKAEDVVYSPDDIIENADSISIVSLGYSETQTDRIHLQTMRQLSDSTNGLYKEILPEAMASTLLFVSIIPTLESGGTINVDLRESYSPGDAVTITLMTNRNESIEFQVTPTLGVLAYWKNKILLQKSYLLILMGGFILLFLLWVLHKMRPKSAQAVLAKLEILDSNQDWYEIKKRTISIGRNQENDLILANGTVSAHHAVVQLDREGKWIIVDTNSTNGVVVDNEKVNSTALADEAIIEIGDVRLRMHYKL